MGWKRRPGEEARRSLRPSIALYLTALRSLSKLRLTDTVSEIRLPKKHLFVGSLGAMRSAQRNQQLTGGSQKSFFGQAYGFRIARQNQAACAAHMDSLVTVPLLIISLAWRQSAGKLHASDFHRRRVLHGNRNR